MIEMPIDNYQGFRAILLEQSLKSYSEENIICWSSE